ncbi:MAG TPA: response regulator [Baekduia sp.]|nr:response regulator [Baekduia sp.]
MIIDDSPEFVAAARGLLESEDLTVVGVAADGDGAVSCVAELRPDVALVDLNLGAESGLDVAARIAPTTTTIIIVSTERGDDLEALIAAGPAAGFVPKARLSRAAIAAILDGR